eukprot:GHVO01047738.1.p1 GENE.GHVO01047738.1~~GHVO01047738.1.p1  ORF type:complete len:166 (+),score=62.70 GHVO01047738.1:2-499(+)
MLPPPPPRPPTPPPPPPPKPPPPPPPGGAPPAMSGLPNSFGLGAVPLPPPAPRYQSAPRTLYYYLGKELGTHLHERLARLAKDRTCNLQRVLIRLCRVAIGKGMSLTFLLDKLDKFIADGGDTESFNGKNNAKIMGPKDGPEDDKLQCQQEVVGFAKKMERQANY